MEYHERPAKHCYNATVMFIIDIPLTEFTKYSFISNDCNKEQPNPMHCICVNTKGYTCKFIIVSNTIRKLETLLVFKPIAKSLLWCEVFVVQFFLAVGTGRVLNQSRCCLQGRLQWAEGTTRVHIGTAWQI